MPCKESEDGLGVAIMRFAKAKAQSFKRRAARYLDTKAKAGMLKKNNQIIALLTSLSIASRLIQADQTKGRVRFSFWRRRAQVDRCSSGCHGCMGNESNRARSSWEGF
jgi:cytochrome c553